MIKLLMESWRKYLKEDSMSYVKDMLDAQNTGKVNRDHSVDDWDDYEDNNAKVKGKRAIKSQKKQKDLFRQHADHSWLKTLNTVHWAMSKAEPSTLMKMNSKDELSTTMSLPNEMLRVYGRAKVGLWIKAVRLYQYLYHDEDFPNDMLSKGDLPDKFKKSLPVLGQDNWKPASSDSNEAIVDNWKPYAVVINTPNAGDYFKALRNQRDLLHHFEQTYERLALSYGIPVVARG